MPEFKGKEIPEQTLFKLSEKNKIKNMIDAIYEVDPDQAQKFEDNNS